MKLWRLAWRKPNATSAFTPGNGEGRFNSYGTGVIYTSSTLPLAVLEVLAHWEEYHNFSGYGVYTTELTDALSIEIVPKNAPINNKNWCQEFGDQWFNESRSLALIVPSVLMPDIVPERNIILNPRHEDFDQLKLENHGAYELDERILKSLLPE